MKLVLLAMYCPLLAPLVVRAGDPPEPDLNPFLGEVRKLVEKYYPKAVTTLDGQTISFEFRTRTFMIHEPRLDGWWQDAFKMTGPQPGGICGWVQPSARRVRRDGGSG
jgi:hypothetical protein